MCWQSSLETLVLVTQMRYGVKHVEHASVSLACTCIHLLLLMMQVELHSQVQKHTRAKSAHQEPGVSKIALYYTAQIACDKSDLLSSLLQHTDIMCLLKDPRQPMHFSSLSPFSALHLLSLSPLAQVMYASMTLTGCSSYLHQLQ